jgi:hypothetical protein
MIRQLAIASVLASTLWSLTEGFAQASPSTDAPPIPAACAEARLTLTQAMACAPSATLSTSGEVSTPGLYIVPRKDGRAAFVSFGYRQMVDGQPVNSRAALAWSCGQYVNSHLSYWYWYGDTYTRLNTDNTSYVCYDSWNTQFSPYWSCLGCTGVIQNWQRVYGNYTTNENPAWDLTLQYFYGQDTFYCRHYIRTGGSYGSQVSLSGWCGQ